MKFFLRITNTLLLVTTIILSTNLRTVEAQENTVECAVDVVVQADDWLSKISDKFFGNVLGFLVIVEATNSIALNDSSYTVINNPNVIEPGWKLCIPNFTDASANVNTVTAPELVEVPAPVSVEHNGLQFIWEWQGDEGLINGNWYFDIKVYRSAQDNEPYDTLVAAPDQTEFFNNKWYSDLTTNVPGCSYWAVQIAKQDEFGEFTEHISSESERLKIGSCQGKGSPFSSPVPSP